MKNIGILCCLLSFFLLHINEPLVAQSNVLHPEADTSHYVRTKYYNPDYIQFESGHYNIPDSALTGIQRYNNRYNLGGNGLPIVNLLAPSPSSMPTLGFNFAPNPVAGYCFNPQQLSYYNTHAPFTELEFIVGAKNEVETKFIHTQNVNKNFNFALNFQRIRTDGLYLRQSTLVTDFALSCNYKSSDKRYNIIASAMLSNVQNDENGGITADSAFQKQYYYQSSIERDLVPISLTDASRLFRSRSIYAQQYFNQGPKHFLSDTSTHSVIIPSSAWVHTFLLSDEVRAYHDAYPRQGFYQNTWMDTTTTLDSTYVVKIENEVAYRQLSHKNDGGLRKIGFGLALHDQFVRLTENVRYDSTATNGSGATYSGTQKIVALTTNNLIAKAEVYNFSNSKCLFNLSGGYALSGYNAGDRNLNFKSRYNVSDTSSFIALDMYAGQRKPDFMFMTYYSNNFYWNNNFQQQGALNGRLYYRMSKYQFEIGGGLFRNTNYVYFNGTQMIQDNRANQGVMGYIQKDFRFKHVLFQNKITFQYVFNNDSVITLPNWFSAHSLSYQNSVFNNALKYQIGIDVYYNSAYYANAYAPSLGQFYVQNQTKIGNYPYLDVFLNLKISRARIFIKYENIDAFLGEFQNSYFRYYYAPHYPWNDGALKMGVLWRFFD